MLLALADGWPRTRAHSIGVSVSDTKPETTIATAIDTANSRNTRPTIPPINKTGMNTAISEKVIDTMVKPISREPFSAASNGRIPPSMWRTMFSSITMASSTTKPTDSVSASNVMLLMEKPKAYIAAKVPTSDTGTASAGMMVAETLRRNRKITMMTSAIAIRQRFLHVDDRRADGERAVEQGLHLDRRRHLRAHGGQALAHKVDHLHGVGVGLALDRQHDGALVVEPGGDLVVFDAVDHAGDLVELDRRAVAIGHNHVAIVGRMRHRAGGSQRHALLRSGQNADRRARIGLGDDAAHFFERDIARGRLGRIDLDADREFLRAIDKHLRDARQLRDLRRQNGLGVFVNRRQRQRVGPQS